MAGPSTGSAPRRIAATLCLRLRASLTWIGIPIFVVNILTIIASYVITEHEAEEVYDAKLAHLAKILLQLSRDEIAEKDEDDDELEKRFIEYSPLSTELFHEYEDDLGFRVWVDDVMVMQSYNTLYFQDSHPPDGFSDKLIDGEKWRFFVFIDREYDIKVEISSSYDPRYELITKLTTALMLPWLFFIPLTFIIILISVKKSLKPIRNLSDAVDRRSSSDLSPITNVKIADELLPMLQALNKLFARISESFRRERDFTDHAAHELRTPLAAMKMQTQVLMDKKNEQADARIDEWGAADSDLTTGGLS